MLTSGHSPVEQGLASRRSARPAARTSRLRACPAKLRGASIRNLTRSWARAPGARAVLVAIVGVLLPLFAPREVSAQEWLKDRRYQEGSGIRVGDLEIHPGIAGEVGYDSNWFLRSSKEDPRLLNGSPQLPPAAAALFRITPSITIGTLTQQRTEGSPASSAPLAFRAGLSATYREFFVGSKETSDQRNVSGNAFVRLDVNQGRTLGFGVFATYSRLIQPSVIANPNLSFNRSDISGGGEVVVLPGGGTLDLRAGYQFTGSLFEGSNGAPFTHLTHEVTARSRWRFRPRTALFSESSLRFVSYPNAERAINYLNDSTPVRTRFGLTGLLTDRFGVLVAAGYGATFFKATNAVANVGDSRSQYDNFNAQAEGTFYLSQAGAGANEPGQATLLLSTLSLGYLRDFQSSLLGNYYDSNKGYAKVVYFFSGRMLIQVDASVEAIGYPQPFYNIGGRPTAVNGTNGQPTGDFTNIRVGGTLFGEYRFSDSFGLNATLDYAQTISSTQIEAGDATPGGTAPGLFDLNWRRVQAFLGARWFY